MEKRCYKVKELQEILGLSRTSIYELLKRKEFQWVVVGENTSFSTGLLISVEEKAPKFMRILFMAFAPDL